MLLTPVAWAGRVWALSWMTGLCPSERFSEPQGRGHHTLVERAWQIIPVVVRWWPGRDLLLVVDSREAALAWLHEVIQLPRARLITRRRLAAAL
jgi:hypothetical protein